MSLDASETFGALLSAQPTRPLRCNAVMFRERDPPHDADFIHGGLTKLVATKSDGASALVAFDARASVG